ncbi:MAG: hypothetical protein ACE15C_18215 [Phycisphaerae bacterium]
MSIRRINSTGRKKILREDARVTVHPDGEGALTFDAALNLGEYELPADANVFVEAYRQTSFMRFPYGTVSAPHPPADDPRRLTEFAGREGLHFRVKVTATEDRAGVLLAEADRIPISEEEEQPDNRIPLLQVIQDDLEAETWRVDDLKGASGPVLAINRRVGDWKAVAASPLLQCLVGDGVFLDREPNAEARPALRASQCGKALSKPTGAGENVNHRDYCVSQK